MAAPRTNREIRSIPIGVHLWFHPTGNAVHPKGQCSSPGRNPDGGLYVDEESGVRDQGSGIRDQGSGVRDQGLGVKRREARVGGSGTGVQVSRMR